VEKVYENTNVFQRAQTVFESSGLNNTQSIVICH